jgi:DNA-binding transcriptional LysR family regulator
MEIRQLQYFVTIAHTGGFRTAADTLGVSLATLSEQIKSLERELGVRLVERGSRSLSLTETGRVLLPRAERLLADLKATREEMLEFAQLERGQIVIGSVTGAGTSWLPTFVAAFLRRHPHVEVRLVERTSSLLLRLLESGDLHVACLLVPAAGAVENIAPPSISVRRLFVRDLVVVVSPRHRLASRKSVALDELACENLILTSPEEAPRLIVDDAFRARGITPTVRFEANDPTALIGLAAEGVGIGITGDRIARRNADKVVAVPLADVSLRYAMALAWSDRGAQTRALATFLEFATEWLTAWGGRTLAAP